MDPLVWAARHGRWVLVAGLATGLAAPSLAEVMGPVLPALVVVLIFVSVLRMRPGEVLGALSDLPRVAGTALLLQLAAPLAVIAATGVLGLETTPLALALTLMAAAPSIMGSPNIAMMLGAAPQHAMRLMVVGTALLPLTILPVFHLSPMLGAAASVRSTASGLLLTIAATTLAAMAVRRFVLPAPDTRQERRMEGASALALAVFVVGLMPQVSTVALRDPAAVAFWLGVVVLANLGSQLAVWRLTRRRLTRDRALPLALIAGNRNVALFLVSLPAEVTAPIMVFIGCYQLPMYLTPLLMRRVYDAAPAAPRAAG